MLDAAAGRGIVTDAVIAKSERERAALWAVRDDVVRFSELKPMFLFDVSAPLGAMEGYVEAVRAGLLRAWPEARYFAFGHLADGNLHFAISAGRADGGDKAAVERIVYGPLAAIGGSVSAEHGIGLEKKAWLGISRTPAEIALMRSLKSALDPRGILNPGRVVDPA